MKEAVYKMDFDCGRQGNLTGTFVEETRIVKYLIENKIPIYFGEVLGKHSDVYGPIDKKEIKMLTNDPNVIDIVKKYELESGYNPLKYGILGDYIEENEDEAEEYYDWSARTYIIYKLDNVKPE